MKRILAISLGSRQTQAIVLESAAAGFALTDYQAFESPKPDQPDGSISVDRYAEHFRAIRQAFGGKLKQAVLALSTQNSVLKLVELPALPVSSLQQMLAGNARNLLQEDLPGHYFGCQVQNLQSPLTVLAAAPAPVNPDAGAPKPAEKGQRGAKKVLTLVGGARREVLQRLFKAGLAAGLEFELALPNQVAQVQTMRLQGSGDGDTTVASLDIGLDRSGICILIGGELAQNRVLHFGGNNLTKGLAEAMKVTQEASESVKVLLPHKVEGMLENLLSALAQEVRGSLDFFESQFERKIQAVQVAGGTARSTLLLRGLERQVGLPCRAWQLPEQVTVDLPPEPAQLFQQNQPQVMAAVGVALDWMGAVPSSINLFTEILAEVRRRRRSPARIAFAVSSVLFALMLIWSAVLAWRWLAESTSLRSFQSQAGYQRAREAVKFDLHSQTNEVHADILADRAAGRFLAAPILDALQRCMVEDLVVVKVTLTRNRMKAAKGPGDKPRERETILVNIQAKDYSELGATEAFIDTIADSPYFKRLLPGANAVVLKQRTSRQVDTANPARSFALSTIEFILLE